MSLAYQIESSHIWSQLNIKKSDDYLDLMLESYDTIEFKDFLGRYRRLITVKYDSTAMLNLLNDTVECGIVNRPAHCEEFIRFLDGLPTCNKYVRNDLEKWATNCVRSVQAFVKKEYEGAANAELTCYAYMVDKIDFVSMFILPRLGEQKQLRYAALANLKQNVLALCDSKLDNI